MLLYIHLIFETLPYTLGVDNDGIWFNKLIQWSSSFQKTIFDKATTAMNVLGDRHLLFVPSLKKTLEKFAHFAGEAETVDTCLTDPRAH